MQVCHVVIGWICVGFGAAVLGVVRQLLVSMWLGAVSKLSKHAQGLTDRNVCVCVCACKEEDESPVLVFLLIWVSRLMFTKSV